MSLRVNRNFIVALPTAGAVALFTGLIVTPAHGQELPSLINVVDYTKLLPLLPEAPAGCPPGSPTGFVRQAPPYAPRGQSQLRPAPGGALEGTPNKFVQGKK